MGLRKWLLLFSAVGLLAPTVHAQVSDLFVQKSGPVQSAPDTDVTYTVTVTNLGPDASAAVSLDDPTPAGMTFVSSSGDAPFTCVLNTCTATSLAANATANFQFVFHIAPGTLPGTTFVNSATATTTTDPFTENNTAEASTSTPASDLLVQKSGPVVSAADTDVTFTVMVTNLGPDDSDPVTLNDPTPAGMTFVSSTGDAPFTCAGNSCTAPSLAAGATANFQFVFHIPPATPPGTEFTNIATATSATDPTEENNVGVASTSTPPPPQPDMFVTKSGPSSAPPDSDVTYTITLGNQSPDDASNVSMHDFMTKSPAAAPNASLVSFTQDTGPSMTCVTNTVTPPDVTCTAATFPGFTNATFTLVVHVPAGTSGDSYTNNISVTADNDQNQENNSSTVTTTISSVDVSVDKTGSPTATAGSTTSYTVIVANAAGGDAAINVNLVDQIPPGTTFASLTQDNGPVFTCNTPAANNTGTVGCTIGVLGAGTSAQFTLTLNVGTATTINNTATVSTDSFDSNPSNDTDTFTTTVTQSADVAVIKSAPATVVAGTDLTFQITATNNGASNAANVTISDIVPAQTTFVSMNQTTGPLFNCSGTTTVTCTIATFNAGATATFDLTVHVAPSATGAVANDVNIATSTTDPDANNNTSSTSTTVTQSADLAVTKTALAAVVEDSDLTFHITATNNGPSSAANVSISDVVPPETTFVSITQTTGPTFNCSGTTTVTCTIATFDPGATAMFDLTVHVVMDAVGPVANVVNISSTTTDPNSANNTSSTSTVVTVSPVDLSITKTADHSTNLTGANAVYTITVTNNGPGVATGTTVTDDLPPGTTFVSATSTQGSCTATDPVVCTIGTLNAGETATITLTITLPSTPGPVVNTATVTSNETESNPPDNAASATISAVAASTDVPTLSTTAMLLLALALGMAIVLRTR